MAIKGEWIRYGKGTGYFARPERGGTSFPAVLVIQEVFGVNEHIEDVTRRYAAAGYAALAPDLFALEGERPVAVSGKRIAEAMAFAGKQPPGTMFNPATRDAALATLPEAEARKILETFQTAFSFAQPGKLEALLTPLKLAVRHLRDERPETKAQKLGCVGFCMGGSLSALLACEEEELSGAAVYYGMSPPPEKVEKVTCPMIGFYGSLDQRVLASIPAFEAAMKAAGKSYEPHIYEGAAHSFFNDDGPSYNPAAARDSFARVLNFFAKNLAG